MAARWFVFVLCCSEQHEPAGIDIDESDERYGDGDCGDNDDADGNYANDDDDVADDEDAEQRRHALEALFQRMMHRRRDA